MDLRGVEFDQVKLAVISDPTLLLRLIKLPRQSGKGPKNHNETTDGSHQMTDAEKEEGERESIRKGIEDGGGGSTMLWQACALGYSELARFLCEFSADLSLAEIQSLLTDAVHRELLDAEEERYVLYEVFTANGQDPTLLFESSSNIASQSDNQLTNRSLSLSTQKNRKFKVCSDVNFRRPNGLISPLYIAAQNGHLDCCEILLRNGADVNIVRDTNATPLFIATQKNNIAIVELLLSSADIISGRREKMLQRRQIQRAGAYNGGSLSVRNEEDEDEEEESLPEGLVVRIDDENRQNCSPFVLACSMGHTEIAMLLLQYGANPRHDRTGLTGLQWAKREKRADTFHSLLRMVFLPEMSLRFIFQTWHRFVCLQKEAKRLRFINQEEEDRAFICASEAGELTHNILASFHAGRKSIEKRLGKTALGKDFHELAAVNFPSEASGLSVNRRIETDTTRPPINPPQPFVSATNATVSRHTGDSVVAADAIPKEKQAVRRPSNDLPLIQRSCEEITSTKRNSGNDEDNFETKSAISEVSHTAPREVRVESTAIESVFYPKDKTTPRVKDKGPPESLKYWYLRGSERSHNNYNQTSDITVAKRRLDHRQRATDEHVGSIKWKSDEQQQQHRLECENLKAHLEKIIPPSRTNLEYFSPREQKVVLQRHLRATAKLAQQQKYSSQKRSSSPAVENYTSVSYNDDSKNTNLGVLRFDSPPNTRTDKHDTRNPTVSLSTTITATSGGVGSRMVSALPPDDTHATDGSALHVPVFSDHFIEPLRGKHYSQAPEEISRRMSSSSLHQKSSDATTIRQEVSRAHSLSAVAATTSAEASAFTSSSGWKHEQRSYQEQQQQQDPHHQQQKQITDFMSPIRKEYDDEDEINKHAKNTAATPLSMFAGIQHTTPSFVTNSAVAHRIVDFEDESDKRRRSSNREVIKEKGSPATGSSYRDHLQISNVTGLTTQEKEGEVGARARGVSPQLISSSAQHAVYRAPIAPTPPKGSLAERILAADGMVRRGATQLFSGDDRTFFMAGHAQLTPRPSASSAKNSTTSSSCLARKHFDFTQQVIADQIQCEKIIFERAREEEAKMKRLKQQQKTRSSSGFGPASRVASHLMFNSTPLYTEEELRSPPKRLQEIEEERRRERASVSEYVRDIHQSSPQIRSSGESLGIPLRYAMRTSK